MNQGDIATTDEASTPQHSKLLIGPSSQLRAPSSLLSGSLPLGLLHGHDDENEAFLSATNNPVAVRPRRLWTIQDTALKQIPKDYPPLNPSCTTYVGDASPSVVAVRISECFRKRSIAVEYDDETVSVPSLYCNECCRMQHMPSLMLSLHFRNRSPQQL